MMGLLVYNLLKFLSPSCLDCDLYFWLYDLISNVFSLFLKVCVKRI